MTITRLAFFKLGLLAVIGGGSLLVWQAVPRVPPYEPVVAFDYPGTIWGDCAGACIELEPGEAGQCLTYDDLLHRIVWGPCAASGFTCGPAITGLLPISNGGPGAAREPKP